MRWIVITLVLLNLGYAIYGVFIQRETPFMRSDELAGSTYEGEKIMLLAEVKSSDLGLGAPISPVEPPMVPDFTSQPHGGEGVQNPYCPNIGPFLVKSQALQAMRELAAQGVNALLGEVIIEQQPDSWVVTEPFASRSLALARLSELQAENVDSYIITDGDMANAISLGLFASDSAAMAMKNAMELAGYSVKVLKSPRTEFEFWLKIPSSERSKISSERLNVTAQSYGLAGISLSPCEVFATAD